MCDARGASRTKRGFVADDWNVVVGGTPRRDIYAHGFIRNTLLLLADTTIEGLVEARTGTWQLKFLMRCRNPRNRQTGERGGEGQGGEILALVRWYVRYMWCREMSMVCGSGVEPRRMMTWDARDGGSQVETDWGVHEVGDAGEV